MKVTVEVAGCSTSSDTDDKTYRKILHLEGMLRHMAENLQEQIDRATALIEAQTNTITSLTSKVDAVQAKQDIYQQANSEATAFLIARIEQLKGQGRAPDPALESALNKLAAANEAAAALEVKVDDLGTDVESTPVPTPEDIGETVEDTEPPVVDNGEGDEGDITLPPAGEV